MKTHLSASRQSQPLAQAAEIVIDLHAATYKTGSKNPAQWRSSLRDYVYPTLGDRTVDSITTGEILACLSPHWSTKHETMRRLKQRLSLIFRWAVAEGHRADNPAGGALSAALPKSGKPKAHHKALAHADVAGALDRDPGIRGLLVNDKLFLNCWR